MDDARAAQEVGWFDREENASGALSSRLSADTSAVRGALGDQVRSPEQALGRVLTLPPEGREGLLHAPR